MNEKYLHWVWEKQRFSSPQLRLVTGECLSVVSTGKYNEHNSGPDFEMGRIEIEGIQFVGSVEIHVKASDWYKHNHQSDEAYKNVILHVVYLNDTEVTVDGYKLPTLVLKDYIEMDEVFYTKTRLHCKALIHSIDVLYLESMKSKALYTKLNLKIEKYCKSILKPEQVFYELLASAFGMKVNQKPFEELAKEVPWEQLKSLPSTAQFQSILMASGLLYENRKRVSIGGYKWNYKGTRPGNYPSRRVGQFATLISGGIVDEFTESINVQSAIDSFIRHIEKHRLEDGTPLFSKMFKQHLLINAVVPYFHWKSKQTNQFYDIESILTRLSPEQNEVIKEWEKAGVSLKNACDTQSILALDRYYCTHKKCLSCEIGVKILNRRS